MASILPASDSDFARASRQEAAPLLLVTSVEAEQSPGTHAFVLRLGAINGSQHRDDPIRFLLSPPAAMQLSRSLRRAVKNYLSLASK